MISAAGLIIAILGLAALADGLKMDSPLLSGVGYYAAKAGVGITIGGAIIEKFLL